MGIDAGGSLIKIAYMNQSIIEYRVFDSMELGVAALWINEYFQEATICLTGGKGSHLQSLLKHETKNIVEFDATCRGIQFLLNLEGAPLESFILTNVGTGTSIHFFDSGRHVRVGGTGVGGGTMMGLSLLLTDIEEYNKIVNISKKGNRDDIDLKVRNIYEGSESPISGDLTASNFGNVQMLKLPSKKEDLLASIIGLVGETVATTSVLAADSYGTTSIVYIGLSFIHNEILREVVSNYTNLRGASPLFVRNGEYSGAVGALMSI
ncbi:type II pantothenate kinase [Paenibacillus sp. IHBB 10380]|uniref:type II pantothenate kinase n=1 Tax=Paenibacillus sp. IHBB 10380 TaxID=1566358 RepID=UPI001F3F2C1D|nr:type II pantothenate kinase [Paenibacillus sp. IHBB 10380]